MEKTKSCFFSSSLSAAFTERTFRRSERPTLCNRGERALNHRPPKTSSRRPRTLWRALASINCRAVTIVGGSDCRQRRDWSSTVGLSNGPGSSATIAVEKSEKRVFSPISSPITCKRERKSQFPCACCILECGTKLSACRLASLLVSETRVARQAAAHFHLEREKKRKEMGNRSRAIAIDQANHLCSNIKFSSRSSAPFAFIIVNGMNFRDDGGRSIMQLRWLWLGVGEQWAKAGALSVAEKKNFSARERIWTHFYSVVERAKSRVKVKLGIILGLTLVVRITSARPYMSTTRHVCGFLNLT